MDRKLFEFAQAQIEAHYFWNGHTRTQSDITPRRKHEEKADNRLTPFPAQSLRRKINNAINEELDVTRSNQPTLREIETTRRIRKSEMGRSHQYGR